MLLCNEFVVLGKAMKSSTGRWVSGDDFFGRERELGVLETRVENRNHLLFDWTASYGKDQPPPGTRSAA